MKKHSLGFLINIEYSVQLRVLRYLRGKKSSSSSQCGDTSKDKISDNFLFLLLLSRIFFLCWVLEYNIQNFYNHSSLFKAHKVFGSETIRRNSRINMLEKYLRWTKHLKLLFELIKVNFYICLKLFELIPTFGYQSLPCCNFWPISVSSLVFFDAGLWSCLSAPLFLANQFLMLFFFFFWPIYISFYLFFLYLFLWGWNTEVNNYNQQTRAR